MAIKQSLGIMEEITDLRTVWGNEAKDFTPWLAENIKLLGDTLDLSLSITEQESPVGNFSLDILAHDDNSNADVVI